MKKRNLSRRHSLKVSLAMAGASHLPLFSIGQPGASANSAANVAYIGVGGIAKGVLTQFPDDNHVALCDVDDREGIQNRERAPNAPMFKDYRRMLDKMEKDIDAVVISTPDHTHFTAAMEAIERGKHVFVQKPLAHDIWQVRTLKKAAAHHGVITQMGNQGHASEGIRRLKEWYDAGICGEVREVVAWFSALPSYGSGNPNWCIPENFPPKKTAIPPELDWDLWLGPTRNRDYAEGLAPKGWRAWWELGNGVLGDMGCHALDAPCWILDLENPTSIKADNTGNLHPDFVPGASKVVYDFPANGKRPPVKVTWYNGQTPEILEEFAAKGIKVPQGNGVMLIGEKNTLYANAWCNNPMVLLPGEEWMEFRRTLPEKTIPRIKGGPHREWLNHVKGIGPMPGSNFEYSAKLTEMILLGVLAQRAEQRIEWDGNRITNSRRFNPLLKTPPRKGWEYGEQYWKGGQA